MLTKKKGSKHKANLYKVLFLYGWALIDFQDTSTFKSSTMLGHVN